MSVSVPAADALHSHATDEPHPRQRPLPMATQEVYLFGSLAVPTILISVGFVVPSFLTAAFVGRHFGPTHLDAYTLANLTGNLCSLSLLSGLYSAADTLCPAAYGAGNYARVGLVACQALLTSWMILLPVNIVLCSTLGPLLQTLGQDETAANLAWQFYNVYAWSLPLYAIWCVVWKFCTAQHSLRPLVVVTLVASVVVLPAALEILGDHFIGTAWALLVFQLFQVVSILVWLWWCPPHNPATWTWKDYTRRQVLGSPSFREFLYLGVGGMLASLEWIYWEAISLIVGRLGIVPLSVHTVPTQVIYVVFMFPLGMGVALSNRIGVTLTQSVSRAKAVTVATLVVSGVGFGFCTWLLFIFQKDIFELFTSDPDVLAGCAEIWPSVCVYFWSLVLFGVNTGIATGLGMQMTLGIWTLLFLWCLGLPASYYFAIVQGRGLSAVWTWITPPYLLINTTMLILFYCKDWDKIATLVRIREGLENQRKDVGQEDEALESLRLTESNGWAAYGSTGAARP